jgi:hypothetical protein
MKTLTCITPEVLAQNTRPISIITPDGSFAIMKFRTGQVIDDQTYWWAVVRTEAIWPEVYTTSLEEAMNWLSRRLLETCF